MEGQIISVDRVEKKRPNLHIIRTVQTWKLWSRVESYQTYVPSSKRTVGNARERKSIGDRLERPH